MDNPKQTLQEILALFQQLDDGIIDLSKAEIDDLKSSLNLKVDGYKDIISRLEAESDRLKKESDKIMAAKKYTDKALDRVKSLLLWNMKQNETTKLQGDAWTASMRMSKSLKPLREPTQDDYIELPSDVVKLKLSWSLTEAKNKLKPEEMEALFETIEKENVQFKPRRTEV